MLPQYVSSSWEFYDAQEHKKHQVPRSVDGKEQVSSFIGFVCFWIVAGVFFFFWILLF